MKIKVLRDYSGKEGTDVDKNVSAGSEHHVSRARGSELFASGLVEILADDDDDIDGPDIADESDVEGAGESGGEKIAPITANKAAPKPSAKAKAPAKPKATPEGAGQA